MNAGAPKDITGWLRAWSKGDQAALEKLIPLVETELRRMAHRYLERGRPDAAVQTTALINQAYARLINLKKANWRDRAHFFAVSARIMRSILVDYARARRSAKRGGGGPPLPLEDALAVCRQRSAGVVAVHETLNKLARVDPRKSQVVELRFFGGLSVEEAAGVLRVSPQTGMRDWRLAKAWLWRELGREAAPNPAA
jgi:RNA polymerase sigma factor (TIGR02999 family)